MSWDPLRRRGFHYQNEDDKEGTFTPESLFGNIIWGGGDTEMFLAQPLLAI